MNVAFQNFLLWILDMILSKAELLNMTRNAQKFQDKNACVDRRGGTLKECFAVLNECAFSVHTVPFFTWRTYKRTPLNVGKKTE